MTLCGEKRKLLLSFCSFDALLALFGRAKPGMPATVTQGAKAGSEILSPQATGGQHVAAEPFWAQGRGTVNQLPSSSQGWFLRKMCGQQLHRQLLSCFHGKTGPKQRQRCQLRAGWGMTSAREKGGFWITSHFAKYQVCPSERCLTQAT